MYLAWRRPNRCAWKRPKIRRHPPPTRAPARTLPTYQPTTAQRHFLRGHGDLRCDSGYHSAHQGPDQGPKPLSGANGSHFILDRIKKQKHIGFGGLGSGPLDPDRDLVTFPGGFRCRAETATRFRPKAISEGSNKKGLKCRPSNAVWASR